MNRVLRIAFLAVCALVLIRPSFGQISVSVSFGPPAMPVYELPPCPGDGYLWTPGYWAWDADDGYYWVPGTWVMPPEAGMLWTPGWWGWEDTGYVFHQGYWAPEVGFYGGVDYGYGYYGDGFVGGRWDRGHFRYNTAVLTVNRSVIHDTYVDRNVIVHNENHVSYNGGQGGLRVRPTSEQERVMQGRHVAPVAAQQQHMQAARSNPEMRAEQNHGKPAIAATARPGDFSGHGVVAARAAGGTYHAPPKNAMHQPATGNARPAGNARPGETVRPGGNTRTVTPAAPGPRETTPGHTREVQPRQAPAPREATPRPAASRETAPPREATPHAPAPREAAPRPAAPRETAPPREATPHAPAPREAAPRPAAPRETAPRREAAPHAPAPREAAPRPAAPRETAPRREAAPHAATPKEAAPQRPAPAEKSRKPQA